MFLTAAIAFREFLEAFLFIGIFLGMSRQLNLKKEKEITIAAITGIIIAILVPISIFIIGDKTRTILIKENTDFGEGFLLLCSGIAIIFIALYLHRLFQNSKEIMQQQAKEIYIHYEFDLLLFFTIIGFIIREGFETALSTAATTLVATFTANFVELLCGCIAAAIVSGFLVYSSTKLPIKKIFRFTEYAIILSGSLMTINGISLIIKTMLNF